MKVLLVNPPVYDFTAYDFWMRPYGLLSVAGRLRGRAAMHLFDFMDRPAAADPAFASDQWGRGKFPSQPVPRPEPLASIPRRYRRYGLPRERFQSFLEANAPFDFALVQTGMTYWYPGVREAIQDIRRILPYTGIVLGGVYATLCPRHAENTGADLVIRGADLEPLWNFMGMEGDAAQPPLWEAYSQLDTGVLKLTDGCPFKCTYCCVPGVYGGFSARSLSHSLAAYDLLCRLGAQNVAFYDDALLFDAENALIPFLGGASRRMNFHTPNALHARLIAPDIARLMVEAGFRTFFLGFESASQEWQRRTGAKVSAGDLASAVENLLSAGAERKSLTAYIIAGHPENALQEVESSMRFAHSLGIRLMLAEFSPIPGTADGEICRRLVDMDEPLWHNKTAYTIAAIGKQETDRLKALCKELNRSL